MLRRIGLSCWEDHLVPSLVCLFVSRAIYTSLCMVLCDGQIGLCFLRGGFHAVHHCLQKFTIGRHNPSVHKHWRCYGVVTRIAVETTLANWQHCCLQIWLMRCSNSKSCFGSNVRSQEILLSLNHRLTLSICLRMKCNTKLEIVSLQTENAVQNLPTYCGSCQT